MSDEKGGEDLYGEPSPAHSELWLDFAEVMGASRNMRGHAPLPAIKRLLSFFHRVAQQGTSEEALATFYAYESQVPRFAQEKARGLEHIYGFDSSCLASCCRHTREWYTSAVVCRVTYPRVFPSASPFRYKAMETG